LREIAQEPPFWRWFSFGWHGLLYYKEVQKILRGEHGPSLENAKRIDLDRWRRAWWRDGRPTVSDGDEFKKKKGSGPVGVEWRQTRGKPETGN
jgi:hypothetical protein